MILVSTNKAAFRTPLAKKKSPAQPSQLAPFFAAHSGGPAAVNGLSFVDFQKFDWQIAQESSIPTNHGDQARGERHVSG